MSFGPDAPERYMSFCTQALLLSEDAACSRIEAARACRRFPVILDRLASGELTLTAVRLSGRHLTPENHQAVLAKAARRSRSQIEVLMAELAPQPRPELRAQATYAPDPRTRSGPSERRADLPSAYVPPAVKRVAWQHDGGQSGYVAPSGRRCTERTFLEFHHLQARAKQGPATVANIRLRCWRHNQYEADLVFGPGRKRSGDG
jgi:hypothetical protein